MVNSRFRDVWINRNFIPVTPTDGRIATERRNGMGPMDCGQKRDLKRAPGPLPKGGGADRWVGDAGEAAGEEDGLGAGVFLHGVSGSKKKLLTGKKLLAESPIQFPLQVRVDGEGWTKAAWLPASRWAKPSPPPPGGGEDASLGGQRRRPVQARLREEAEPVSWWGGELRNVVGNGYGTRGKGGGGRQGVGTCCSVCLKILERARRLSAEDYPSELWHPWGCQEALGGKNKTQILK